VRRGFAREPEARRTSGSPFAALSTTSAWGFAR